MGFNKKAKREAAQQQASAYAQQQAAHLKAQADIHAYQSSFDTRNKGIIDLRNSGTAWLDKYNKGTDISELIPTNVKLGQQMSDTVKATVQAQGKMGDASQLQNDSGYHNKLNSIMGARIGKGLAAVNSDYLQGERGIQTDTVMGATQFLNADSQAGLGMNNQLFGMTNQIWQNATTRRDMEIKIAQQSMGNLMGWIELGTGVATGLLGAFKTGGGGGGGGNKSAGKMANSSTNNSGFGATPMRLNNGSNRQNPFGYYQ